MRKFLNTLYVLNKDAYLSLEGENIVLLCNKTEIGRVPLHRLEGIVCFSYPGASPALMGKCARLGVDLSFFSPQGRFLALAVGEERGNVLLRQTQYRIADSEAESCLYARNFILGKVYNARWVLERATRDHPQRVPVEQLKRTSAQLAAALPLIEQCDDLDQLRGLEGEAAQRYFDCFDSLILQQHDDFSFAGRSRRPPLDNTNALLSFAYSLLASDCTAALQSVGLDPYVGFLHRARPGRRSLALDLMEELRTVYADRFVLSCINQKIMTPKHFQKQENGAVLLTDEGRRAFLGGWQTRKQETITHPFLNEKLPWGLVPYRRLCFWPAPCGAIWSFTRHFSGSEGCVCWSLSPTTSTPKLLPGANVCAKSPSAVWTTASGCRTPCSSVCWMPRSMPFSRRS